MFQRLFQKSFTRSDGMTQVIEKLGGEWGNRTPIHGFAIRPEIYVNQGGHVSNDPETYQEPNTNVSNANLTDAKKNPDALAGATGAEVDLQAANSPEHHNSKRSLNAMSLYAKSAHKAVSRMVGYALTLGDSDGYLALSDVLALRLTDRERAGLAYAALRALDHDTACSVADAALGA